MKFVVDDCMGAVLGDTQLRGNVMLRYSSVCHDDVINRGNGHLCGTGDWPSPKEVMDLRHSEMGEVTGDSYFFNRRRGNSTVFTINFMMNLISKK